MIKYFCDDCGEETSEKDVKYNNYSPIRTKYVQCLSCTSQRLAHSMKMYPLGTITKTKIYSYIKQTSYVFNDDVIA